MIYDAEGIDDSIKNQGHWAESNDTPTLTLFLEDLENRSLRRVKQLGVTGVSMAGLDTGGLETWTDQNLKRHIDRASDAGLELRNVMFNLRHGCDLESKGATRILKSLIRRFELLAGRACQ